MAKAHPSPGLRTGELGAVGRPMVDPCQALWSAVLLQSIHDSTRPRNSTLRVQARAFLEGGPTRNVILGMLMIDAEWFVDRCLPVLRCRWEMLDQRGTGELIASVKLCAERGKRSWETRRARQAVKAQGRPAMDDLSSEQDRPLTGLKTAVPSKSTCRDPVAASL